MKTPLYTANAVAAMVGWHVNTVRKHTRNGNLPHTRLATGEVRYRHPVMKALAAGAPWLILREMHELLERGASDEEAWQHWLKRKDDPDAQPRPYPAGRRRSA